MTGLIETRKALADSLADAGYPVYGHVPEKVAPPVVIIGGGDPYITESGTFDRSQLVLNLEVFLVTGTGTNAREVHDLDTMLTNVLPHFGDWTVSVAGPEVYTVNQSRYLGCKIACSSTFDLN